MLQPVAVHRRFFKSEEWNDEIFDFKLQKKEVNVAKLKILAIKKAAAFSGRAAWYRLQNTNYQARSILSTQNHKFFLAMGRRVQETPCQWNVRLHR